jgi:hypothetical protein
MAATKRCRWPDNPGAVCPVLHARASAGALIFSKCDICAQFALTALGFLNIPFKKIICLKGNTANQL